MVCIVGFHFHPFFLIFFFLTVPLGGRRRFGPAPAEETAPPQLAQPSPSAYPRPPTQEHDSPKRGRDESPSSGDPKGKHRFLHNVTSRPGSLVLPVFERPQRLFRDMAALVTNFRALALA